MSETKIQLGKLQKNVDREFHFALLGNMEQPWLHCFRKVCEDELSHIPLKDGGIEYPLNPSEFDKYSVVVTGDSESQSRVQLEKAINRTNEIQKDPIVVEYWSLQLDISRGQDKFSKEILQKRLQEVETKLLKSGKFGFVVN